MSVIRLVCLIALCVLIGCGGRPPAGGGGGGGKLFRSAGEFFAGMPKDKEPKDGENSVIERDRASEWVKANRQGAVLQLDVTVKDVTVSEALPSNDGQPRYRVALSSVCSKRGFRPHWGKHTFSGEVWEVTVAFDDDTIAIDDVGCLAYRPVDAKTAERLRSMKGNSVTVTAPFRIVQFNADRHCLVLAGAPKLNGEVIHVLDD